MSSTSSTLSIATPKGNNCYEQQLKILQDAIIEEHPLVQPCIKAVRQDCLSSEVRVGVYRKGYKERLLKATLADYPALIYYFGERLVNQWVLSYVDATPSKHWDLNQYSLGFADFVRQRSDELFAYELATLESAIAEVFWLPESEALDMHFLANLSLETLPLLDIKPRLASRLFHFHTQVDAAVTVSRNGEAVLSSEPAQLFEPFESFKPVDNWFFVYRHCNEVKRYPLTEIAYLFLKALQEACNFGEALQQFELQHPEKLDTLAAELTSLLTEWVQNGVLILHTPRT